MAFVPVHGRMIMHALPVELLTPVGRVLRGCQGVQLGPTAVALLIPVINVSASRRSLWRSMPEAVGQGVLACGGISLALRAVDDKGLEVPTAASAAARSTT